MIARGRRREDIPGAWRRFKDARDQSDRSAALRAQAREAIILHHAPLVGDVVGRYYPNGGPDSAYDHDDLRSAGYRGLVEAVDRFDPARGSPFRSYAILKIRGAVSEFIRGQDPLSRDTRAHLAALSQLPEKSRARTSNATLVAGSSAPLSLSGPVETAQYVVLEDILAHPGESVEEAVLAREQRRLLFDAMALLRERDRDLIITCYWGGVHWTELAKTRGISISRIHQLRLRGMKRLRKHLEKTLLFEETAR